MSEHRNDVDKHDSYDHGERLQRNMPAWKQREITEHDRKRIEIHNKLPYELTKGVTAAEDGLLVSKSVGKCIGVVVRHGRNVLVPWGWAAERLRYREGEPWCTVNELVNELGEMYECIVTFTGEFYTSNAALSDIANMLIRGNTDAFRVLYDCIEEFGNE